MAVPASYNVAPTQDAPVVRVNKASERTGKAINQYPDTLMVATAVSTRVNTPKNDDAKLIEAV